MTKTMSEQLDSIDEQIVKLEAKKTSIVEKRFKAINAEIRKLGLLEFQDKDIIALLQKLSTELKDNPDSFRTK